jgi:hypothetical protein
MSDASLADLPALHQAPASTLLRELAAADAPSTTLGSLLGAMGSRAHGLALVLLALPDAIPLPIPSTSTVLGIPLVIIAAHLVVYGEGARLPARAERLEIPQRAVRALARFGAPPLQVLERLCKARWPQLTANDRILGLLCLYLTVLLLLPIPFFNAAPALCLIAVALGMVHRDGLMVAVGGAGTVALSGALVYVADWLWPLLSRYAPGSWSG